MEDTSIIKQKDNKIILEEHTINEWYDYFLFKKIDLKNSYISFLKQSELEGEYSSFEYYCLDDFNRKKALNMYGDDMKWICIGFLNLTHKTKTKTYHGKQITLLSIDAI